MYTSILTVASLCAIVLANAEPVKRQDPTVPISSILAEISSLQDQLQPPASIAAELTGVPASVTAALGNPSAISALESQFLAAGPPAWFSSLPADAQSYVLALGPKAETILPEIISLEIAAGLTTVSGAAGTGAAATSTPSKGTSIVGTGSNSTITTKGPTSIAEATTGGTSNAASASAKTTASSAKSTSSSSAGAAQVTGAIAAGVIAAGSFLGLALSL